MFREFGFTRGFVRVGSANSFKLGRGLVFAMARRLRLPLGRGKSRISKNKSRNSQLYHFILQSFWTF
jgi:hypothetical protein